jgi:hypothetical protein
MNDELKKIIAASALPAWEKELLLDAFATLSDSDTNLIVEAVQTGAMSIFSIADNLKKKIHAGIAGSAAEWDAIIEEEVRSLENKL